ncbi:hypothetical protein EYF80_015880 [Liparis tanakae]|uniref:Uncharacterized protein n=1 Tax=Liparis tanakae TaxID=230148 RepID=A0A4Z2I9S0_9TELE|nr:hypothetical protein EYF80_015880 [Liparis tanakae]
MTLRRPAAHLQRAPNRRRSGDESYWGSLTPEGEVLARVSRPQRAPRPQSAIEGGRQLDGWLEHLQRIESELLRAPVHDQAPTFSNWTRSTPAVDKEPAGPAWRQPETASYCGASSSCGSTSLCESSLGSQDSLQTGYFPPPERKGSWERARVTQAPRKEQAQLSNLAPVKIGWLPIQRRVMVVGDACNQRQSLDHAAGQVKLKQAITPTFQMARATVTRHRVSVEHIESHCDSARDKKSRHALALPAAASIANGAASSMRRVPDKKSSPANEGNRPGAFQALRRAWNTNRVSAFPGGRQSKELPTGTSSVPNRSFQTPSAVPFQHATFADPRAPLRGTSSTDTNRSHAPLHRTGGVQPLRATAPLCGTNSSSQPPHVQTHSAVTTLIPQNKASFSSITISSRKVSRSASLPGDDAFGRSGESPSPTMEPNSRMVTVQRKATIVKVTEQRMVSSPSLSHRKVVTPPDGHALDGHALDGHALDTVVHRRKATIIKVTEHRESWSPRHPGYRHSYTEGAEQHSGTWGQGQHSPPSAAPSHPHRDSTQRPNSTGATHTSSLDAVEKNDARHTSTLSLVMSGHPAVAEPAPSEGSRQTLERPRRPLSCYGNMFGHTDPSGETAAQPAARKLSFGLPQGADINPTNSNSLVGRQTAGGEAGQPAGDPLWPNGGQWERLPPQRAPRRSASCLTLITNPDPTLDLSEEEVLALNAAAIIANIKLQRQGSKKKTPNSRSEKDSAAPPHGNTETVGSDSQKEQQLSDRRQMKMTTCLRIAQQTDGVNRALGRS